VPGDAATDGLRHLVLFYREAAEYSACLIDYVRTAAVAGEPVLIAIPGFMTPLPDWPSGAAVETTDMAELGRNPARIIPALRAFCETHRGRPVRVITESVWPGRSRAEVCEALRHEVLIEQALAGLQATILCPYNAAGLPAAVLAEAGCSHRWQLSEGDVLASTDYAGPGAVPGWCQAPLPDAPANADVLEYRANLRPVRDLVAAAGRQAGLDVARVTDLTLAVSEVAANTLRHTHGGGVVQAWRADGEVLCQITDTGFIADPLAGLRRPPPGEPGGQGLWLVNQVCDLVELRSTAAGTSVRMHMRIHDR
jgi:anti-sigma regulatory factor (Ser/Thr protein kinase)